MWRIRAHPAREVSPSQQLMRVDPRSHGHPRRAAYSELRRGSTHFSDSRDSGTDRGASVADIQAPLTEPPMSWTNRRDGCLTWPVVVDPLRSSLVGIGPRSDHRATSRTPWGDPTDDGRVDQLFHARNQRHASGSCHTKRSTNFSAVSAT